jgi:hypothetical protein
MATNESKLSPLVLVTTLCEVWRRSTLLRATTMLSRLKFVSVGESVLLFQPT